MGHAFFVAPRVAAFLALIAIAACDSGAIKTHPVEGRVQLDGGDVALLKGSNIEYMQQADPMIRPTGIIAADGSFAMKTLYQGEMLNGAPAGNYQARIILADEGEAEIPKRPPKLIHSRYLDFATSKLTFAVPGEKYIVTLSGK
jgi:hypothetical protein